MSNSLIATILGVSLFLAVPVLALSENESGIPPSDEREETANTEHRELLRQDSEEPIVITSDHLVADNKLNRATFTGSVKAVKGEITLFADEMVVFYRENQSTVSRITTTGNLKVIKGERIITSENGEYFAEDEKIVFTGSPKAVEGKNIIEGSRMVYFVTEERFFVENSNVRLQKQE